MGHGGPQLHLLNARLHKAIYSWRGSKMAAKLWGYLDSLGILSMGQKIFWLNYTGAS